MPQDTHIIELLSPVNRRQLLKTGLLAAFVCLNPLPSWAQYTLSGYQERSLSMLNTHTGERLQKLVYWEKGIYIPEALSNINHVLRDHRTDEVHSIDPMTLDLLAAVSRKVDAKRPFEIISGYRSPKSNQMLRNNARGVAKNSFHMQGKAVSIDEIGGQRYAGTILGIDSDGALRLTREDGSICRVLAGEEGACAAKAGSDLISDQQDVVGVTKSTHLS